MLRLIGALVVVLLILGPLLAQAGLVPETGVLHDFVALETHAFASAAAWLRNLVDSHTSSVTP